MIEYDATTALIVVDIQNDFADPGGNLYVRDGEQVVPLANRQVEAALAAGAPVFYSQDWHPEHTPHFARDGGTWPVHCVQDTRGAELHPGLLVHGGVVRKGSNGEDGYSAFSMRDPETGEIRPTELNALLQRAVVERVVVLGLATDYCVRATVLDALARGYETRVVAHAVRAVDLQPGDGQRALDEMEAAGAVVA